jgi:hypothetical protein
VLFSIPGDFSAHYRQLMEMLLKIHSQQLSNYCLSWNRPIDDIFPVPSEFSQVFTEVKEAQKFLLCMELMIRRAQEDRTSMAWQGMGQKLDIFDGKSLIFLRWKSGK